MLRIDRHMQCIHTAGPLFDDSSAGPPFNNVQHFPNRTGYILHDRANAVADISHTASAFDCGTVPFRSSPGISNLILQLE